jgi:1,4-alpha-glucan branching enzyme
MIILCCYPIQNIISNKMFHKFVADDNTKFKIMAITKQYLKSKPVCKVTFSIEAEDANEVSVVGSFNDWDAKAAPLKKLKNGTFKGTVDLATESSYEFKYLIDETVYVNDDSADAFAWNEFAGADNSVINV